MLVMKTCYKCKGFKDASEFSKDGNRKDGLDPTCKACKSAHQKKRFRNDPAYRKHQSDHHKAHVDRNRNYVYNILRQSKCIDCGNDCWQVLEFDHVRGHKVRGICDMIRRGMSISVIRKEIDKCEVRCANCHRLKTAKQFGWLKAQQSTSTSASGAPVRLSLR